MYYGKRTLVLTCLAAMLAGTVLHFVYQWFPCALTGLFSPINESLWEHTKLILWPYLAAAVLLNRGRPGGIYPWLLILPVLYIILLGAGYLYHIPLNGEAMWVDIAIFIGVMVLGFWLPTLSSQPFSLLKKILSLLACLALVLMTALFTLYPPDLILFADLSAAGAWFPLPC